ncbi:calcium/calmodulin-dependent protein kinase type 1 [Aphelenchoides avenae]|nr:calcium/calmodulin-dependent protein kinase type 1 [Aphelenchus avenae]
MTAIGAKSATLSLKQCNGLKTDLQLSDSGLTLTWLLNALWENCEEFRCAIANGVVHNVSCQDISEGKGFTSKVYKTVLTFKNSGADSFTVMMKVPSKEAIDKLAEISVGDDPKENKSSLPDVYESHNTECKVLGYLRTSCALPLPTVWYTQLAASDTIGAILMPDLSEDSVCPGWAYSLTVPQIKNVVRHFAAFHAHLLCISKEESTNWEALRPPRPFWIHGFHDFLHDSLRNIPECMSGEFNSLLHQLAPAMTTDFFRYTLVDRPTELGLPLVLLHGDTGSHNIFFKKNPDNSVSSEVSAFIDWQIVFKGNQFFDVTRSIYVFADAEARREAEQTLVEDYYEVYQGVNLKGRSPTGLEHFREAYALAAVHQALCAAINPGIFEAKKGEYSSEVYDAFREKFLLRSKLALRDAVRFLKQYAPQFLAE